MKNEIFRVIDKNVDNIIEKEYYLCKVKLSDLIEFVKRELKDIDVGEFNKDSYKFELNEYYDEDMETDEDKNERLKFKELRYGNIDNNRCDEYYHERSDYLRDKERNFIDSDKNNLIFNIAVENNFISIYYDEFDGKNFEGDFYLLDGFRRILFDLMVEKDVEKDVYVKIYNSDTTDTDLMELMFSFNLWKIPQGVRVWFDRGWKLFIFKRLGIMINEPHFVVFDSYLGKYNYGEKNYFQQKMLVTSKQFYNDIKIIDSLVNSEKMEFYQGVQFNQVFVYELSKIRIKGNEKKLEVEDWLHFLDLNYGRVDIIKDMRVAGHYMKRIKDLCDDFFEVWVDDSGLEKMKESKPKGETKMAIVDYILQLGKGRDSHSISVVSEDSIFVDKRPYIYKDKKIYAVIEGFDGNVTVRIYLFFDKFYVFKYDKKYYIVDNKKPICVSTFWHNEFLFKGDKKEIIKEVKIRCGVNWKPNSRETEFML